MSVFGEPSDKNTEDFVKQIVEAKGDSWSDPQVLAKGKLEADSHIENLEAQVANLEAQIDKQDYAKSLLEQIEKTNQSNKEGTQEPVDTKPAFGEEQIKSLIQSTLTETQEKQVFSSNIEKAEQMLKETFGDDAGTTVEKRSKELNLTKDQLQEMAAKSPEGFMALMGQAPKQESSPTIKSSTINTSADSFSGPKVRDWKFYNELRKSDPKTYRSAAVQKQMLEDRKELGDKFN